MPSFVSIIIPCYNEQARINNLLAAIYSQTYPRADMEVVIADGMSTDNSRGEIANFIKQHPDLSILVVDNPARIIPAALNRALKEARGEIIVRLDAHSIPYPDYVERCVAALESGLGENVGGIWEISPGADGWIAQAIAVAAAHPLGVGDALYRHAEKAAYVDTVPFGAFKREQLALVGFFDESLLTNEDYEFNTRIRQSGGRIWLDPAIRSIYYARPTLAALARQFWRYGYWKRKMLQRYPETLRWRQGLPPLFVLSLLGGAVLAILFPVFRLLPAIEVSLYAIILILTGCQTAIRQKKLALIIGLPLAIAVMHIAWGAGFLWSMIK
ncbi:MAG: glycosyltransferase family 2 protein [Anaerolineales bacterium]|nr:glycosyltransferase family 2 protein [Anaerolineales bacterium]